MATRMRRRASDSLAQGAGSPRRTNIPRGTGGGIVVYELDEEGRIAHTWVIGGTP
jgi:hypothetical protein